MLKLAGYINILIAVLHLAALFSPWEAFRLVGVEEQMVRAAQIGKYLPGGMTVLVMLVFALFGVYALVGAGVLKWKLPFLKTGVYTIGALYLLRGISGIAVQAGSPDFLQMLFSLVALGIGGLYLAGGWAVFTRENK